MPCEERPVPAATLSAVCLSSCSRCPRPVSSRTAGQLVVSAHCRPARGLHPLFSPRPHRRLRVHRSEPWLDVSPGCGTATSHGSQSVRAPGSGVQGLLQAGSVALSPFSCRPPHRPAWFLCSFMPRPPASSLSHPNNHASALPQGRPPTPAVPDPAPQSPAGHYPPGPPSRDSSWPRRPVCHSESWSSVTLINVQST